MINIQGLAKISKTITTWGAKNSPTLLTGIGVTGLISTAVLTRKGTIKALAILDDELVERNPSVKIHPSIDRISDEFTFKEKVKLTWKCYVPAAALGAITIGCMVGANKINLRRNAALAGLYSLSETALKEYQAKVVEKIGEGKAKEIKDEIKQDIVDRNPVSSHGIIRTGHGDTLCYDEYSGRYFYSDMNDIKAAVNNINRTLRLDNEVCLNEFYSEIGLGRVKMGDLLVWYIDYGQVEVGFSSTLADDGRPCLVIDFDSEPKYCNRDF